MRWEERMKNYLFLNIVGNEEIDDYDNVCSNTKWKRYLQTNVTFHRLLYTFKYVLSIELYFIFILSYLSISISFHRDRKIRWINY